MEDKTNINEGMVSESTILSNPFIITFWIVAGAFISSLIGALIGSAWLLPLLNTVAVYPLFFILVKSKKRTACFGWFMIWALILSVFTIIWIRIWPEKMEAAVINGTAYREEMFEWIKTGIGPEGTPSLFIPQHLLHFSLFCLASFVSLGFLGLLMGSILTNYMNFYVAGLIMHSKNALIPLAIGWPVWSIIRVAGFIIAAIALSELALSLIKRKRPDFVIFRKVILVSLALIVLDMILKAVLAPFWQSVLFLNFNG